MKDSFGTWISSNIHYMVLCVIVFLGLVSTRFVRHETFKTEYEGHRYIRFYSPVGAVHDPDCPCTKKEVSK